MDTNTTIQIMGGRSAVMQITGLSKSRISQWVTEKHIPRPWMLVFHGMKPSEIPHPDRGPAAGSEAIQPVRVERV